MAKHMKALKFLQEKITHNLYQEILQVLIQ